MGLQILQINKHYRWDNENIDISGYGSEIIFLQVCIVNINVVTTDIVYLVTKTCVKLLKNFGLYHKNTSCFIYLRKEEDELVKVQIRTEEYLPLNRAAKKLSSWARTGLQLRQEGGGWRMFFEKVRTSDICI